MDQEDKKQQDQTNEQNEPNKVDDAAALKNIFIETMVNTELKVKIKEIIDMGNIDALIERKLKNMYEGICIPDGYVKKGSIKLLSRSKGCVSSVTFGSDLCFNVKYKAEICKPVVGNIVHAKVINIKPKVGILAKIEPLDITIIKDYHPDVTIFDNINIDDVVTVRILDTKYKLNSTFIDAVGELVVDA